MTDAVLSQIEQIIRGIETRTPHSDDCAIWGGVNPEGPCDCDVTPRRRTEIARTIEGMVIAAAQTFQSATFENQMAWQNDENASQLNAMEVAWAAALQAARPLEENQNG